MTKAAESKTAGRTAANVGYEAELWKMADALRGSMDAAEYKHQAEPAFPHTYCDGAPLKAGAFAVCT